MVSEFQVCRLLSRFSDVEETVNPFHLTSVSEGCMRHPMCSLDDLYLLQFSEKHSHTLHHVYLFDSSFKTIIL